VAFRLWVIGSPLGLIDGDEAVVGLMARRLLHGHAEAFFWGQEYGGSAEAALVALLLAVRVPGRWAMELVPIGLHAASASLVWRIGRRTVGERAAALGGAICWAASPALVWWSTKERGFYGVTLVCGLAVLLLTLRLGCPLGDQDGNRSGSTTAKSATESVGLGLVAGIGWWSSPQVLHVVVPCGLWLAWTYRRRLAALARLVALAGVGAAVGALPWLWANAHTGLASFDRDPNRWVFGGPYRIFFTYGLPMVLGLKAPITLGWQVVAGKVLYVALLGGFAAAILRWRPPALRPVLLTIALYPLIFAALPTTYYYGEPRYLDFLWPLLALLAGWAVAAMPWLPARVLAVAGVLALTANGLSHMVRLEGPPGKPFEDISPRPVAPLVAELDRLGIDRAYADYWVAYRLTFATDDRIRATPLQLVRSPEEDRAVRNAAKVAYVVDVDSCIDRALRVEGVRRTVDVWRIVVPDRAVPPEVALPDGPC
jgi:hypothetical protein